MNHLSLDQVAYMAERTKLPKVEMLNPKSLQKLLRQAKSADSTPMLVTALLRYASSSGGLTDVTADLYAWLHEKAKTG